MHERQSTKDIKMTLKDAKKFKCTHKETQGWDIISYLSDGQKLKSMTIYSVDEAMGKMVPSCIVGGNTN